MAKLDPKLRRHALLLCLPTVAVVLCGVYFLAAILPDWERKDGERLAQETLAMAREINENNAAFVWEHERGIVRGGEECRRRFPADMAWKDWNSRTGTKSKDNMWGYEDDPGGRLVWRRAGDLIYGRWCPDLALFGYTRCFGIAVPAAMAVLIAMTAFGVRYFIGYVRTRDDFLAASAHDLTTPLVGMRYLIGRRDDEARRLNERMLRIVANITDFLQLGGRRPRPDCRRVDLREAYAEAYGIFRDDFRDALGGDDVPVAVAGDNFEVLADPTLLVQTIWNILGNDLKYAVSAGGSLAVEFARSGSFAIVRFADNGPGMSAAQRRRAFDRYYRARTVLESGKGGFGIGLCNAREFARAMRGEITVEENHPHGCIFTLKLPLAAEDEKGVE